MQQAAGLLSKVNDSKFRLLTMQGELILEGKLDLPDGFYSSIDLSSMNVKQQFSKHISATGIFNQVSTIKMSHQSSDCECANDCSAYDDCSDASDCDCSSGSDDCSNPNDCDCDCAEP